MVFGTFEKFLAGFNMIDMEYDSDDEEVKLYKGMMTATKGKGIINKKEKKVKGEDDEMFDNDDDGRGYITIDMDKKKNLL